LFMSNDFNTVAARSMNSASFGDSLTASYFGSQAQIWGDQSMDSALHALRTGPEAAVSLGNDNQRAKVWKTVGNDAGKLKPASCTACNVAADVPAANVNLNITRGGDLQLTQGDDRSMSIGDTNLPGFNFPEFGFDGSGGGGKGPTFIDVAGDRYEKDGEAVPVGFWDSVSDLFDRALTGKADCKKTCTDNGGPPDAIAACIKDCEQSNVKNDFFGATGGMKTIILVIVGIVLLAAGLNALTRG
jgi:hypothetical protein